MQILISTRLHAEPLEQAQAADALRRCELKYGEGSAALSADVDWSSPDGEPEKFNDAVSRVLLGFDAVVLIAWSEDGGPLVIGRGQHKCAELMLRRGRGVFLFHGGSLLPVKALRLVQQKKGKGWKGAYAMATV